MFNTSTNQPSTQNSLQGLQAFRMHRTVLKTPSTSHIIDCIDPSPLLLIPVIIFSGWWFHSSAHHDQTGLNIMTAIKRTLWIQQLVLVDGWPTPLINISQMGVLFPYIMEKMFQTTSQVIVSVLNCPNFHVASPPICTKNWSGFPASKNGIPLHSSKFVGYDPNYHPVH